MKNVSPNAMNPIRKASYDMFTKSSIPDLFRRYAVRLDPAEYLAAAHVFPMRINNHVAEDLIDWYYVRCDSFDGTTTENDDRSNVPNDPMFQLAFPQPEMLHKEDLQVMLRATREGLPRPELQRLADGFRGKLNPHPAHQKEENVPKENGKDLPGMQHKYRETLLFFPSEGQYCHAYCSYCFRWAQFTSVGSAQTFKSGNAEQLCQYVQQNPQIRDVLLTGGDPMVMSASALRSYIGPLIAKTTGPSHLDTIRIGSKSLAWWPYKYLDGSSSKEILDLFGGVVNSGRQMTFQAHFSHPREVEHSAAQEAMRLIRMTGAQIRTQAPLIRHVNDNCTTWRSMWNLQTRLGAIPYYMFVERDTGASHYFSVPLAKAFKIFSSAYSGLAGTARTVRGPSMSAAPGKASVIGDEVIAGEHVFVLKFLQARDPEWVNRIFFAKYDPNAVWLDGLRPAFGEKEFFFEEDYRNIASRVGEGSSGQLQKAVALDD